MNNYEIKSWRIVQLAANILYRYCGNVRIESQESLLFDIIVTDLATSLKFGVKVGSSSFVNSDTYKEYIDYLESFRFDNSVEQIPLLLMLVNESSESASIGFQIARIKDKIVICKNVSMKSVNEKNMAIIMDQIKSMDDTIRVLSTYGMKIIKRMHIEIQDSAGVLHFGTICYLRDFSEKYKMNRKIVNDEKERFDKLVNGIIESEYPEDELDIEIMSAVKNRFPNASSSSNLLLFSSELRDVQIESTNSVKILVPFITRPLIASLNPIVMQALKGIEFPSFKLDLYIRSRFDVASFNDLSFDIVIPIDGLLKKVSDIKMALSTLHSPKELVS